MAEDPRLPEGWITLDDDNAEDVAAYLVKGLDAGGIHRCLAWQVQVVDGEVVVDLTFAAPIPVGGFDPVFPDEPDGPVRGEFAIQVGWRLEFIAGGVLMMSDPSHPDQLERTYAVTGTDQPAGAPADDPGIGTVGRQVGIDHPIWGDGTPILCGDCVDVDDADVLYDADEQAVPVWRGVVTEIGLEEISVVPAIEDDMDSVEESAGDLTLVERAINRPAVITDVATHAEVTQVLGWLRAAGARPENVPLVPLLAATDALICRLHPGAP